MRIEKDLVAASATPLVLGILAEDEASYGYAILKRIRELSNGNMEWTDGMLYPLLHRLERLGHLKSSWQTSDEGRRRKHYTLTETGRQALAERQSQWAMVSETLDHIWHAGIPLLPDIAGGGAVSEQQIQQWRGYVQRRAALTNDDVAELEGHLRGQVDDLVATGLADDEAFLVAVKRMGSVDELSREFAREHSERLWKQLVLSSDDSDGASARDPGLWVAIALGAGAALTLRAGLGSLDESVFARLAFALVLPWMMAYFVWRREASPRTVGTVVAGYAAVVALLVAYPFDNEQSDTLILTVIHTPILLWLLMGVIYVDGDWRSGRRRMDFIRFTGEWAVYYFLLAAGGGLLLALAAATFNAVDLDAEAFLFEWVLPFGAAGAAVIAAWLVESKQNVIENIAPVLARVFSPLTVLLLVALLVAFAANPGFIDVERELLIMMTVILVLVLALWLYAVSARPPQAQAGLADWLQLLMVATAIIVDLVVLIAMAGRIAELGLTPNRAAALGLNIILLVNLAASAWLGLAFVRGSRPVAALEGWQTGYLPVYAVWAAVVVVAWGPLFQWA